MTLSEQALVERLIATLPNQPSVLVGPGDDCAVIDVGIADQELLFKTDAVVEGVHFTREIAAERVGHKALARCFSDIAAMGGKPTHALVTLGLPKDYEVGFVERLYAGMVKLAERFQVSIVGGETTANPGSIFVSISLIGRMTGQKPVLRSGARVGDAIFVTGTLGGSIEGKHLDFEPRLVESNWLVGNFELHAMIDVSDGLATDLRHILKASGVGAEVLLSAVPVSRVARTRAREAVGYIETPPGAGEPTPGLKAALTDGEDFELLFTVASKDAVRLLDCWKAQFPDLPLSCVGKIIAGTELLIRDKNGIRQLAAHGYDHFSRAS
jgi:thiamine-monophosphate kinase